LPFLAIMASLALIGGFDPRPRLGSVLMDGGVVKKIDKKGKLVVQLTEHRETRKVSMMSLFSNYYIPRLEPDINFQVYFIFVIFLLWAAYNFPPFLTYIDNRLFQKSKPHLKHIL